jgi:putative SOS response-associated peptidase YedK
VRLGQDGRRELALLRWGLIPRWSREARPAGLINARAETAAAKPAFRDAFRRRRCPVVADGFYEWQATAQGKQPWFFRLKGGKVFGFVGIWETWQGPEGPVEPCALLTTTANEVLRTVHERMPVIVPADGYGDWLKAAAPVPGPYPAAGMEAWMVGKRVNSPQFDDAGCVQPA